MPKRSQREAAKRYYSLAQRKAREKKTGVKLTPPSPYRSWLEADVAHQLEKEGIEFDYEGVIVHYVVPAQAHTYLPDFPIRKHMIIETKGRWTSADRKKMSLVLEQNPDKDIRILFALDNKIARTSRTRYSTWCEARGIPYAIGTQVPEDWLEEIRNAQ